MLKKVNHIGIVVANLEEAAKFYRNALGAKFSKTEELVDQGVKLASFTVGESDVELLQPLRSDSTVARYVEKRGEGLHHICYEVDDLEKFLHALKEKGMELIDEKPRIGAGGKKIAFLHPKSTHGVLIELTES